MISIIICLGILLIQNVAFAELGLVILSGGKDQKTAEQWLKNFKAKSKLEVSYFEGYPKILESKSVAGLKPGFWVVVAGACKFSGDALMENVLKRASDFFVRNVKGAYVRKVPSFAPADATCPLIEGGFDLGSKDAVQKLVDRGQRYCSDAIFDQSEYLANYALTLDPNHREAKSLLEKLMVLQTD